MPWSRAKVSSMAWPASWAWYAWYRVISHACPRSTGEVSFGSDTCFHVQPWICLSSESGAGISGFDELGKVGFVADPVAHEPEPGQGFLGPPALGGGLACHDAVLGLQVMADQGGVNDGGPPHRLPDDRKRPRPVPCGHL